MGILDFFSGDWTDDPAQNNAIRQGLLAGAFGAMAGRGNRMQAIGQGGLTGLLGYGQAMSNTQRAQREEMQNQLLQLQLENAKKQSQQQQRQMDWLQGLQSPQMQASQAALSRGGGPTVENAQAMPQVDPMQQMTFEAARQGVLPISDYISTLRKENAPVKLGAGEAVFDPRTGKPLFSNPKAEDLPSMVREYQFAVSQGEKRSFTDWATSLKKAGATNVSLNADKGFAGAFGKNVADAFQASQDQASAAQQSNATIADIRNAMGQGGVILGPGAEARQTGLRIGQMIGVGSQGSAESLARTRVVEQGLASIELAAAGLMKGQGQVTEAERKIIARAAAGKINELTPQELDVALRAIERNNNYKIQLHDQRARQLQASPLVGNLGGMVTSPPVPAMNQGMPSVDAIDAELKRRGGR